MTAAWFTAFAPASIANFGSGFDAFAAAISLVSTPARGAGRARPFGDRVSVRRARQRGVTMVSITGDGGRLPKEPSRNCAAIAAAAVLRRFRAPLGLDLALEKGLPLSSGLGSSAASAAAGAWAAALALEDIAGPIAKTDLLESALAGEHAADDSWHGDNVWASLLGGSLIVLSTRPAEIVAIDTPPRLRLVAVHPDLTLDTRRARAALPKAVPLGDATTQAARFGALIAAWPRGDRREIGKGFADCVAEPHRARLVPGFEGARRAALRAGAYGLTFAGAGPTLVSVTPEDKDEEVGQAIQRSFARSGIGAQVLVCRIDPRGARRVQ